VTAYPDSWYAATAKGVAGPVLLDGDEAADVCVIGGGYTGLSAALHLRRHGLDTVLLEARRVGWGASGRNGGQVGSGQRQDEASLAARFGRTAARRLWTLAEEAKATVRRLVSEYAIDCDLRPGQLVVAARSAHADELRKRAGCLRRDHGYGDARYVGHEELRTMLGSAVFSGGLLDTGAAHLHALNYALGLARACRDAGVRLYEESPVQSYSRESPSVVRATGGAVRARHLVLACNGYLGGLEPRLAGRIMPINNFIIATGPLGEAARELIRDDVCVHDTRFVVNYFRKTPDQRLLFGGGETYTRGFPADIAAFVRPHMLRIFPQLDGVAIDHAWGGTLAVTLSRLPHLGRLPPNAWFAHGFSGHGISIGTLVGKLVAEAISGHAARFEALAGLPARRFPGGRYLRGPALMAGMSWYALRDRL